VGPGLAAGGSPLPRSRKKEEGAVSGGLGEALGVALLAASLAVAVIRPRGLPEATGAVPAALLVVVLGVLPLTDALDEVRALAPTRLGGPTGAKPTPEPVEVWVAVGSRVRDHRR